MEQAINDPIIIEEPTWKKAWRPITAYVYLMIVVFDFMLAPLLMGAFQATQLSTAEAYSFLNDGFTKEEVILILKELPKPTTIQQWQPLTLGGGAFFHIAFGGILGVGSYTRGKEKQARVENGYIS